MIFLILCLSPAVAGCSLIGVEGQVITPTPRPGGTAAASASAAQTNSPLPDKSPLPGVTATATAAASLGATTTYSDTLVGFALDYPVDWNIVAVTDEIKAESLSYTASIASFSLLGPGTDGIPAGGTKLDVTVIKSAAADLKAAMAEWNRQNDAADPKQTVLSDEDLTLPSGIEAKSLLVESLLGQAKVVITAMNGHMLLVGGLGDYSLFEAIVRTLRPVAPAAQ